MKRFLMKRFLSLSLVTLLSATIIGCGMPNVGTADAPAAPAAPAPATPAPADTGSAELEPVTLHILDSADSSRAQRELFHEKYMDLHPHVTIEYTSMTLADKRTALITMTRAGDAPDVFMLPQGLTLTTVINEGWFQALTPLVTDEFIASIDPLMLVEGHTTMNGVIYALPEQLPLIGSLFYYNRDLLDAAGVTELPTTYSEFLEVARRVTEAGNGEFFGIIEAGRTMFRLNDLGRSLVQMAGGRIPQAHVALTVNNRAPYDLPEVVEALEFLGQLMADGSFHPDTLNLSGPEARQLFGMGQAAFMCQGLWSIGPWFEANPDINLGVMAPPRPDGATVSALNAQQVNPHFGVSAITEHPHEAARYLMAKFSMEYGYQADSVAAGIFVSIIPEVNERYLAHPVALQYFNLAQDLTVSVPMATQRNFDVFDFYTEVTDVQPDFPSIVQGVLAGSITNIAAELAALADNSTTEWQRASNAIGLDFNVFEFPNWVPGVPFTDADYAALD